jgi:hypothetical protein
MQIQIRAFPPDLAKKKGAHPSSNPQKKTRKNPTGRELVPNRRQNNIQPRDLDQMQKGGSITNHIIQTPWPHPIKNPEHSKGDVLVRIQTETTTKCNINGRQSPLSS